MSNSEATFSIGMRFPDADSVGDVPDILKPHPSIVRAPYTAEAAGEAALADGATSGDEIAIDLDGLSEVTAFVLTNRTGQDLSVAINGVSESSSSQTVLNAADALSTEVTDLAAEVTTLKNAASSEHTAAASLDTILTAQLAILNAFDDMDPAADIVAAIATANTVIAAAQSALASADATLVTANTAVSTTAVLTANTALGTALDNEIATSPIFTLPDGGVLAYAAPDGASTEIESISLFATDTQVGDASVSFRVFGDPE